jgi:hypothetical protein
MEEIYQKLPNIWNLYLEKNTIIIVQYIKNVEYKTTNYPEKYMIEIIGN